jgi:hypothetical protein
MRVNLMEYSCTTEGQTLLGTARIHQHYVSRSADGSNSNLKDDEVPLDPSASALKDLAAITALAKVQQHTRRTTTKLIRY